MGQKSLQLIFDSPKLSAYSNHYGKCFIIQLMKAVDSDAARRKTSEVVKLKMRVLLTWFNLISNATKNWCCTTVFLLSDDRVGLPGVLTCLATFECLRHLSKLTTSYDLSEYAFKKMIE